MITWDQLWWLRAKWPDDPTWEELDESHRERIRRLRAQGASPEGARALALELAKASEEEGTP